MITTYHGLPTKCEFCGSQLEFDGVNLICVNDNCKNKATEKLKALVTNLAPIDGLGFKTIDKIMTTDIFYKYNNYTFTCLEDILKASPIPGVTGNGERGLFNKMLNKIQNDKITVSQFLLALNIQGLGKIGADAIQNCGYAQDIFNDLITGKTNTKDRTSKLLQDSKLTDRLYDVNSEENKYFVYVYSLLSDRLEYSDLATKSKMQTEKGTVVITGSLSMLRNAYINLLKDAGWKVSSNITKDTDYLITNTPESGTSKNKKADELGVVKITEAEFNELYL